jgi:beta-glucanase (GH16 family)
MPQECWGNLHPDKPWTWYDPNCIRINEQGELELTIDFNPQKITVDGKEYNPNYGMGLVSTTENNPIFKYGEYTWVAKLPKGRNLWPGLWMWAGPWPPEIDVAECWTNECGGYFRFNYKWDLFQWNVQSNYYNKDKKGNHAKCIPILKCPKDPSKNFIEYKLKWSKYKLEVYYDGKLVRTVDDLNFMYYLNQNTNKGMNVVMNCHPTEGYMYGEIKTPMIIKSFSYKKEEE